MTTKQNIQHLVEEYIRLFPDEFKAFRRGIKMTIDIQKDKFGTLDKSDMVERKLGEFPETLYTLFQMRLTTEDTDWLYSKTGSRWFFKKFNDFSTTQV